MHIAYTITYNVHTASRVSEAQKRGGAPPLAFQNGLFLGVLGGPRPPKHPKLALCAPPGNFLFCAPAKHDICIEKSHAPMGFP